MRRGAIVVVLLLTAAGSAAADTVQLPRPRPAQAPSSVAGEPAGEAQASECRLQLSEKLAVAPSLPPIDVPGGCVAPDVVRLEGIVLRDGSHVAVTPPATLRCSMAQAIVNWVRDDVAAAVRELGASLRAINNAASFDCRGMNNIPGAKLSEHGRANALDIGGLRLSNGDGVQLTDPHVAREFREEVKRTACARFSTVLGPGSDGYHEEHVHVDLMERAPGRFRFCHWDVRDPEPEGEAETVPLPRPRPNFEREHAAVRGR